MTHGLEIFSEKLTCTLIIFKLLFLTDNFGLINYKLSVLGFVRFVIFAWSPFAPIREQQPVCTHRLGIHTLYVIIQKAEPIFVVEKQRIKKMNNGN